MKIPIIILAINTSESEKGGDRPRVSVVNRQELHAGTVGSQAEGRATGCQHPQASVFLALV